MDPATTVTILMRGLRKGDCAVSSGEWVRARVLERRWFSISGIKSLGRRVFTTLDCTMFYLFPTPYVMLSLDMMFSRALNVWPLAPVSRKAEGYFPMHPLLSNVRVDRYPPLTNDATLRALLADLANSYHRLPCRARTRVLIR
jgi:hypothetical protein